MTKILITGVSGYVGSWCMHKALEAGYLVVGTVRDPDSKKCAFLREAMQGKSAKISAKAATNLKLVKADLLDGDDAWNAVFENEGDIVYVLHTASPYFAKEPTDPDDYIRPARQGTQSVVRAASTHGVQHMVVTSSVGAIWDPTIHQKMYTQNDWSDVSVQSAYGKSKTLAEKVAWDTVEGKSVKLSTVCPMMIIGPTLYNDKALVTGFESGNLCIKFMTGKLPLVPRIKFGISDVRDVAEAHLRALTSAGSDKQRFICSTRTFWMKEIAALFSEKKPELKIPAKELPSCFVGCLAMCSKDMKTAKTKIDRDYSIDTSPLKLVLNMELTPEGDTVLDMMNDMIQLGAAPATK